MSPPEPLAGPEPATLADVDALNRLFADAFTDRYHRDGMPGVRVPFLNPAVWRFAIEDAGEGAMVWRDAEGALAGFNLVHRSGVEGWMGPLALRPALQGAGHGRRIVEAGMAWLRRGGARSIGLETMPRTVDNLGFYARLGFLPGFTTVTLLGDLPLPAPAGTAERWSAAGDAKAARLDACRALTDRLAPGVDYAREVTLTDAHRAGDTTLVWRGGALAGFAVWHDIPLALGRPREEVRLRKVVATDAEAFLQLVAAAGGHAARRRDVTRLSLRCETRHGHVFAGLVAQGFQVQWTDLRMTLGPAPAPGPGIVMSNWEI